MGVSRRSVCGVGLMVSRVTKQAYLDQAIELLEAYRDGEDIYGRVQLFLRKYHNDMLRRGPVGVPLNPKITKLFEQAKELVRSGRSIKYACLEVGLTKGQWDMRLKRERQLTGTVDESLIRISPGMPVDPTITEMFEKAKEIVKSGKTIAYACDVTGLTRDQWTRRLRMQKRDRNVRDKTTNNP